MRTPHRPDGLTKSQAEARLRDLMRDASASVPQESARTLQAATDAWLATWPPPGRSRPSVRAYSAAMGKWFLPTLGSRSLDRITTSDVEHAMRRMRDAGLSDKSIRNYVGALRALFNYATDPRRRWATRNPVADVDLPKAPTYTEIRYLTRDEVWALADAASGESAQLHRALYLTAAMTGMRIGELQALDWRSVDYAHARIRVRRTFDRKTKRSRRRSRGASERAIPMPDAVAGELERLFRAQHPDAVEPDPEALVFADPLTGSRWAAAPVRAAAGGAQGGRASTSRSGSTRCGTATGRRWRRRACRCGPCRSGWGTATSRRRSGTPTTARTLARGTRSRRPSHAGTWTSARGASPTAPFRRIRQYRCRSCRIGTWAVGEDQAGRTERATSLRPNAPAHRPWQADQSSVRARPTRSHSAIRTRSPHAEHRRVDTAVGTGWFSG